MKNGIDYEKTLRYLRGRIKELEFERDKLQIELMQLKKDGIAKFTIKQALSFIKGKVRK